MHKSTKNRLRHCLVLRPGYQHQLFIAVLVVSFVLSGMLGGCRSQQPSSKPVISFTRVPPAARGGRERVDTIAGTVAGALPGQKIVIYAQSGPWWVQPWPDHPLITIQPDSTWSTATHLGFEYSALLVRPGYEPPPTLDVAPAQGGDVVAIATTKGSGSLPELPTVPLHFSGYDWKVFTVSAVRGGVNNLFDADNVWTDAHGALHLRIKKKAAGWTCAHLMLTQSLGYGTYNIVVQDTSHLEAAALLSLDSYDEWAGDQHFREMDIEIGRWGNAASKTNVQYGIQPFYIPGNVAQFNVPPGTLTHSLLWEPGQATFKTAKGSSIHDGTPLVFEHTFTSGVPSAGQELFELMFYIVPSDKSPIQKDTEVVIEKFEYLP
jgi:hypothetical protein